MSEAEFEAACVEGGLDPAKVEEFRLWPTGDGMVFLARLRGGGASRRKLVGADAWDGFVATLPLEDMRVEAEAVKWVQMMREGVTVHLQ